MAINRSSASAAGRLRRRLSMLPIAILATLVWVSASLAWAWQPRHVPAAEASKLAAPAPCAATMAANGTSAVADGARLELPQAAKPGTRMRTPSGVEMVWIPAGEFSIGSSPEDRARILRLADRKVPIMPDDVNDEGFGIRITLKLGFWMARYEVTQSQWKAVMGNNPSYWQGARNRLANDEAMPVERVSYEDVQAFLRRLNERNDGYIYRLPSEAEWEYACRAGTTTDYAGPLDEMSWYANNSGEKYLDVYAIYAAKAERYFNPQQLWQQHLQPNGNQPHPVGARPPNAWGLYDMHGNVWEWVAGTETVLGYVEPFPRDGSSNLLEPERAGRVRFYAVIRGGAYHNAAWQCRSAERDNTLTIDRFNTIGFRVVAVPRQ